MEGSNIQMRQKNMRSILLTIKDKGPISKKELQEITGLSWGTVTNLVNALVQKGYVYVCDKMGTGAGRKIELFDIDNKKLVVAVSIRNDNISVIVTDLKGRVKRNKLISYTVMEKDYIISQMSAVTDALLDEFGDKIQIISFAAQGFVDKEKGISKRINRIKNWENVNLKDYFENRYKIPVLVEHDINCALRFEMFINRFDFLHIQNALLISIEEHGIGMSVFANGTIYSGAHGEAGEIGELILQNGNSRIPFDKILYDRENAEKGFCVNFEKIKDAAANGDKAAQECIEKISEAYGLVVVNMTTVFDPEVLILHGKINSKDSPVIDGILKEYNKYAFGHRARIIFSESGNNAVNGAALIGGETVIDNSDL